MHSPARSRFPWLTLLAVPAGLAAGALIARSGGEGATFLFAHEASELGRAIGLAWMRALAAPLIVSSIILGAAGLEPMRSLGSIARKTVCWMVATSILAVSIGFAVVWAAPSSWFPPAGSGQTIGGLVGDAWAAWAARAAGAASGERVFANAGWIALVGLSLGFAYQRNQIEEGHGRLIARFCQALEEMLVPLLRWTRRWIAVAIFLVIAAEAGDDFQGGFAVMTQADITYAGLLAVAAAVYVIALVLLVWIVARVPVWKLAGALVPAIFLAFSSRSAQAALPLTMDAVRARGGVSNRVASVTVSLCGVLHRDGLALGLTVLSLATMRTAHSYAGWPVLIGVSIAAGLLGGALAETPGNAMTSMNAVLLVLLYCAAPDRGSQTGLLTASLVVAIGAALSVFSHGCAAVVIARSEGEYWVPGPPPAPDDLQALKASLESAES